MEYDAIAPQVRSFLVEAEQIAVLSPEELEALCIKRDQGDAQAAEALYQAHFPMLGDLIQHLPRDFKTPELLARLLNCLRGLTDYYDFREQPSNFGRTFSRVMRSEVGHWLEEQHRR